jgi:intergrase/recombinase
MWARRACDAALRRERVGQSGKASFNLSFNGLRKFTSSELLDAGFNISVVAERQGHGPQVLAEHYSKARMSARRKAAEYLGQVVHGASQAGSDSGAGAHRQ